MLIFHKFPTRQAADDFAAQVRRKFYLPAVVYDSQEQLHQVELVPPIVLVERPELRPGSILRDEDIAAVQRIVEKSATAFGGELAGT